MNKKFLLLVMAIVLLLFAYTPVISAQVVTLHRADYCVFAEVGGPESVDGAYAYDTASFELIFNVYDTLMWFDVDRSLDPTVQGLLDQFVPSLAVPIGVGANPELPYLIEDIEEYDPVADETWLQKFTFKIREGVKWHDAAYGTLTTEDVEYSYERWITQDRSGGNVWLILSFMLGVSRVPHPPEATEAEAELFAHKIDQGIQHNATHVWIHRNTRKLPAVFLQTIAQGWASIYCKDWCVALGDFPGFEVTGYEWANWGAWHDPAIPPMDLAGHPMMGTGPYKLEYLDLGVKWSIVANDDYWGGWPTPINEGYFRRITFEIVEEWTLRKMGLLDGTYDMVYVPLPNIPELIVDYGPPEVYLEGIRCIQPLAELSEQNIFFGYNVSTASLWCGPGFDSGNPYVWGDDRIPINFCDDLDLRKAFALIWDARTYINEVLLGEAIMPASYHVMGLAYFNPTPDGNYGGTGPPANEAIWSPPTGTGPYPYVYEVQSGYTAPYPAPDQPFGAEYYFKKAWGGVDANDNGIIDPIGEPGDAYGLVWTNGFRFTLTYVADTDEWATAADMLKTAVEGIHPTVGHFNIDVVPLEFGTEFLPDLFAQKFPLFIVGWLADYADPDNFAHPYMHTEGTIFYCQNGAAMTGVNDPIEIPGIWGPGTSDELIEDASFELDPARREAMYHKLQEVFHERVINIPISQETERHWERTWVRGWYFNTLYPGHYFYHYWRRIASDLEYEDLVNIYDKWILNDNWGPKFKPEIGTNYRADIDNDGLVGVWDKMFMNYQWGLAY